jgi:hypothetical protein
MLAFISAAAVGIERILEGLWTFVDFFKSRFSFLGKVDGMLTKTNSELDSYVNALNTALTKLKQNAATFPKSVQDAEKQLTSLQTNIALLKTMKPNDPSLQDVVNATQQGIAYIQSFYPEFNLAAGAAPGALSDLSDFLATFASNPARRLISLFLGALAGLLVAGYFGLDLISAALGTSSNSSSSGFLPHPTVAITGLIIGLGSSPTHEIIQALQNFKQSQASS